jgi:hypothetical protein
MPHTDDDLSKIVLLTPIHKACNDEPDLYDQHAVRVLPVPGEFGNAVACALNGRIFAVAEAESHQVALIPGKAMPASPKGEFVIEVKGKVDDIVVGRTQDGPKKGVLCFEAIGDAKLRSGVDVVVDCARRLDSEEGVLFAIDPEDLLQLAKAIAHTKTPIAPVWLYAQRGKPTMVISSGGIGVIGNPADADADPLGRFRRMANDVQSAFRSLPTCIDKDPPEDDEPSASGARGLAVLADRIRPDGELESVTISTGGRSIKLTKKRGKRSSTKGGGA